LNRFYCIILILGLPIISIDCQVVEKEQFVQVDGLVLNKNGVPLPNVNIISFSMARGTTTERNGVYSIISTPGDTLLFSAIGYKKSLVRLPSQMGGTRFTNDVVLEEDTIRIDNVVILPWKTYDEFMKAVIAYDVTTVETKNMNINIALIRRSLNNISITVSPEAGYRYAMRQNYAALQTKNAYPVNNLLNPFAWAKLIKGIKSGMFKSEPVPKVKIAKSRTKTKATKTSNNAN
jgi:hypothetical protein